MGIFERLVGRGSESDKTTISVAELKRRMDRGEPIVVLDVRQPTAYAQYPGAVPGSRRIPPGAVPERYQELPSDRLIVPYCT
jgi:rhodanese-related sulfurtransferase